MATKIAQEAFTKAYNESGKDLNRTAKKLGICKNTADKYWDLWINGKTLTPKSEKSSPLVVKKEKTMNKIPVIIRTTMNPTDLTAFLADIGNSGKQITIGIEE